MAEPIYTPPMIRRILLISTLILASSDLVAQQSPLERLQRSEEFRDLIDDTEQSRRKQKRRGQKYFDKKSEYGKLFLGKKHRPNLIYWLAPKGHEFPPGKVKSDREEDYIWAQTQFEKKVANAITMRVMLPHPKAAEAIELGLVKEFRAKRPKEEEIEFFEELELHKTKAELFLLKDGSCKFEAQLARQGSLSMEVKECLEIPKFKRFLQSLTWDRMDRKLKS